MASRWQAQKDSYHTSFLAAWLMYRQIPASPSTNIALVEYDDQTGTLRVSFVRAGQPPYLYFDVPKTVADGFATSGMTAGKYFRYAILRQFQYAPEG